MRQKHTRAKKARRLNLWSAYQNDLFSTSVFWRRVRNIFGSDARTYDEKHPDLDGAVQGMKARMAQNGNHRKV